LRVEPFEGDADRRSDTVKVLGAFVFFALAGIAVAIGICSFIERYSENAGLLSFLGLFAVNFVAAWHLALFVTERFLLTDDDRAANEAYVRQSNERFRAMMVRG
jgi:hypothetical protein